MLGSDVMRKKWIDKNEKLGLRLTLAERKLILEFSLRDIEDIEDQANRRLIEDYASWLVNYG